MVRCSATCDDAFEGTTRSVGCAAVLLPRISVKAVATWFHKQEKAVSNSKAEHTQDAPSVFEINMTWLDPVDEAHDTHISTKPVTTWYTTSKDDETVLNSKAAGDRHPPFCLEIGSGTAGRNAEEVKTPISSKDAWAEMRRRFKVAHGHPAPRASSQRVLVVPARRSAQGLEDASHSETSVGELAPWEVYVASRAERIRGGLCV